MQDLEKYFRYFPYFAISFVISFLLTPVVGYLARKLNVFDRIIGEKNEDRGALTAMHKIPLPKLGGLAVIIPFLIIALVSLPLEKELAGLIIGVLILTIGGYLDDRFNLPGITQFIFQFLAALTIVLSGTGIEFIRNPFGNDFNLALWRIPFFIGATPYHLTFPSDLITIFWIMLVINSINWVAGIDGLVEGITGISAIIITLLSIRFFTHPTAIMGAALAGGVLGFLPFNFNPAKIISGSIGDYNYGFLLAVLSIYSGAKFATALILLGIPILDAIWVTIYRIRLHKPKNVNAFISAVTAGDKIHLHHRLLKMGFTVKQVDYIEYAMVALLGLAAFLFTGLLKTFALFFSIIIGVILILYSSKKLAPERQKKSEAIQKEESPEKKFAY